MIGRFTAALALCAALFIAPAAARADDEPTRPEEDRGTAFQRVTGPARDNVPGGKLMVIAYGVVWMTIFGYVFATWRRQSRLRDDLSRMQAALEEERKKG